MNTPNALVLSGTGRYADPWHPFDETSAAITELLRAAGFAVQVSDDVDAALAGLGTESAWPDLLAVNVGLPRDGGASPGTAAASRGLEAWVSSGRPVLASHVSSTSFVDSPGWEEALGGRWVRGTSMHPDYGTAHILVDRASGPVAAGIPDFELSDERYSWLRVNPSVKVHARHWHDGTLHPVAWSHLRGQARTFYDALGHDAASFESAEHRELLRRGIAWLADGINAD